MVPGAGPRVATERETGIGTKPAGAPDRVYPSWHMPPASEIAVFTVSDEADTAQTLFGTLNGAESSFGRAVNVQIPAKRPLASLIPVSRSNATHGPGTWSRDPHRFRGSPRTSFPLARR